MKLNPPFTIKMKKCKKCNKEMKRIEVDIEGAKNKAISYQCSCGEFEFEDISSQKVITELKTKEQIKPKFLPLDEALKQRDNMFQRRI